MAENGNLRVAAADQTPKTSCAILADWRPMRTGPASVDGSRPVAAYRHRPLRRELNNSLTFDTDMPGLWLRDSRPSASSVK